MASVCETCITHRLISWDKSCINLKQSKEFPTLPKALEQKLTAKISYL